MRSLYHLLFIILFFGCATLPCCAQYYFKHYKVEDGLAHNHVNVVMQDSKGLMWIGSRDGLNRFDGYTFKVCRNVQTKNGNIGDNNVSAIAEGKNGMLWIGTCRGGYQYNPYKETFTRIKQLPFVNVDQILIDNTNAVHLLAGGSLYKYIPDKNTLVNLKIKASNMAFDKQQNLWVADNDGTITVYNPKNRIVSHIKIVSENIPANLRSISKVLFTQTDDVLIGCIHQGLKSYNIKTGLVTSLLLKNNEGTEIGIRDIAAESNSQYWVATDAGLYVYDLVKHTAGILRKRIGDSYAISDNNTYALFKDKDDGMWLGTYNSGADYYSKENARFEKYYPLIGSNSISGEAVGEICADSNGDLWINTEDAGLNKLNLQTQQFTAFTSNFSLSNISFSVGRANQLYTGPFLRALKIFDGQTNKVMGRYKITDKKGHLSPDDVACAYVTKNCSLLIATKGITAGLFLYNESEKSFTRVKSIPDNLSITVIMGDSDGLIWAGTADRGVFYFDLQTGRSGNIHFGDRVNGKVETEFAICGIFEDTDGSIWFTTEGGGLIKLNTNRKTIEKYNTRNGLPSNMLFSVLEDDYKRLWVSSVKGLICMDLRTKKISTYTQANGLITDQFNYNSAYKDQSGKMYFGSVKGLVAFDPSKFREVGKPPPTYITGLQINNKDITPAETKGPMPKSILYTDTLVLNYGQNNLSIEFAALNYSSAKVTRYRYLMKGLDKNWTYFSTNRNAYFTGLVAGNYTFVVQAESNVGKWIGDRRLLFIKILPPFWNSNPGYMIYTIIFGIFFYIFILYHHQYQEVKSVNKLRLFEHEKEKEIYQAKIEFFTNIAHEIQTPLTLISVPVERVISKIDDYPGIKKNLLMIGKYTNRLIELTSQLLDFRQTEMGQFGLNFVNIDINKILSELVSSFRELAKESNITLEIELPKNHVIAFVDREALIKICNNLISNAIKYGASKAFFKIAPLSTGDEHFTISFQNDGNSIPEEFHEMIFEPFFRLRTKEKPGTGIGLPLAKSLTELHNGSLVLVSGDVDNIVFELKLPVHQKFEFNLSNWKKIN